LFFRRCFLSTPAPAMLQLGYSYLTLPPIFYSHAQPEAWNAPELIRLNHALCNDLSLDSQEVSDYFLKPELRGRMAQTFAQAYAGNQFGHFTRLGDGRALVIGEYTAPDGRMVDLQLKGSGRTAYSRGGDGRATLRAMLREYIMSEAMHHLGIPTSRSLAVVRTGNQVQRDGLQEGAVLLRVMNSHIRVGTFELAAHLGTESDVRALTDYSIGRLYPDLARGERSVLALIQRVMGRQIELVAHWMRVGFIHGVMNTDNMAISGETFDYGPCAFLNAYHPEACFSSIDRQGRYAFGRQPIMAQWNLARWVDTLLPLLDKDSKSALNQAQKSIDAYSDAWNEAYNGMMCRKIGLNPGNVGGEGLYRDLLEWMGRHGVDYTQAFVALTYRLPGAVDGEDRTADDEQHIAFPVFPDFQVSLEAGARDELAVWLNRWLRVVDAAGGRETAFRLMRASNPVVIPRNHTVEAVLDEAEAGRYDPLNRLLRALTEPYSLRAEHREWMSPPTPDYDLTYRTYCGT